MGRVGGRGGGGGGGRSRGGEEGFEGGVEGGEGRGEDTIRQISMDMARLLPLTKPSPNSMQALHLASMAIPASGTREEHQRLGLERHLEVGSDDMWAPDLQLASGLAVPRQLLPLIIHNAHVCEEGRPSLSHPVLHLLCLVQRQLTALQDNSGGCPGCLSSLTTGAACICRQTCIQVDD